MAVLCIYITFFAGYFSWNLLPPIINKKNMYKGGDIFSSAFFVAKMSM